MNSLSFWYIGQTFISDFYNFYFRPSPFFSLFSVVRPTQIFFAFSKKKKKSYAEGNDTLFQTNVTLIRNIDNFLPYSFGGSCFFRCSRSSLTTTSIFPSSIAAMLTLLPRLVVSRLHEYYAEIPGLLVPDSFSNFLSRAVPLLNL